MVRKRKGKEGQGEGDQQVQPSTSQEKETEHRGDGDKLTQPSASQETAAVKGAQGKKKEKKKPAPEKSQVESQPVQTEQRQVMSGTGDAPAQGARGKQQPQQERRQPTPEVSAEAGGAPAQGARGKRQPQQERRQPTPEVSSEAGGAPAQGARGKRQPQQERRQPTPEVSAEAGGAPAQGARSKRQPQQERRQPTAEVSSEAGGAPVQGAWAKRQPQQERRQPTQEVSSEVGGAPAQGARGKQQPQQERRQPTPEVLSEAGGAPVQGAWAKRQPQQERRQQPQQQRRQQPQQERRQQPQQERRQPTPEQSQVAPQQQQRQVQPQTGPQRQAWGKQPSPETSAAPPGFGGRGMPRRESGGHPAQQFQQPSQSRQPQHPQQPRQQPQQPQQPRQQPQQPPQTRQPPQQPQATQQPRAVSQQHGDVASVTKQFAETTLSPKSGLPIPMRKDLKRAGTLGRRTRVETNHVSINFSRMRNTIAIHYDVAVTPETPKRLIRGAVYEFLRQKCPGRYPAFDGVKNLYSSGPLPFGDRIEGTIKQEDEQSNGRAVEFKIVIKQVNEIDLSTLQQFIVSDQSLEHPQTAIQCLDVVFRSAPSTTFVRVGRSFFTPPQGNVVPLGDGLDLWYGFFQSAILGWKAFLNVDVAHKGFPKAQHVLSLLCEIMECRPDDVPNIDFGREAGRARAFETALKGLKVSCEIPRVPSSKRTYSVNGFGKVPKQVRFKNDNGQEMTVYDYHLKEKKYSIRYLNLPCLHVGPRDKNIQIVMELCTILPNQVTNRKLNELQTRSMIRAAATPTYIRKQKIQDAFQKANFNNDPCLREFGLSVSQNFEKVDARVMDPPSLEYQKGRVTPRQGVWRADAFKEPSKLIEWTILNLDYRTRDDKLLDFSRMMVSQGKILGMEMAPCRQPTTVDSRRKNDIEQFLNRNRSLNLIVVVLPNTPGIYSVVKQIAELAVGVVTQCIKAQTMSKMNTSTAVNILLKVNAKLNGVNHIIASVSRPAIMARPCMIMGADVTHPSPDAKDIPSVAAVVASHDANATRYNFCWRLQPPKVEIIEDLQAIVKEHLLYFFRHCNGHKPENILFFRDGVSEGQFKEVLQAELLAIRRACSSLQQDYKPSILFLVVQKRHHTRFFPIHREDEDGKNKNVPAGTIVDTEITHPQHIDFYLCSHASIQGVARPTKYRVLWNDKDLSENEIEELTYFLCHLFTRCTRTVSYPAPTYYAHLAAFRARHYIEGSRINFDNLAREMQTRQIKIAQNPMFFV